MIIVEHGKLQVIVSVKLHISFNRNNLQAQVSTDWTNVMIKHQRARPSA